MAAVRQSLHQSFRSLVASPSGEAKAPVPDHEDNWEAKGSRMALQLEDLHKSLEIKMHDIKLNRVGVATPNVLPDKESSSAIRQEIDALLEKFGEEYGKEHGESIDDVIDAIAAIITQPAQLVITEKLYNEMARGQGTPHARAPQVDAPRRARRFAARRRCRVENNDIVVRVLVELS